MSGWLKLNAAFDGRIADIRHPVSSDFLHSSFTGSGSIKQADIGLKKYDLPIKGIQSGFAFNGNDLQLQELTFKAGRSDFNLHAPWAIFFHGFSLKMKVYQLQFA